MDSPFSLDYIDALEGFFLDLTDGLLDRVEDIANGRVIPALTDLTIGSARRYDASVLFFDIRGFTKRTSNDSPEKLSEALYLLDCVIPIVMQIVYDHGGHIEKNTGDGIMGLFGLEDISSRGAKAALDASMTIRFAMDEIVNPHLKQQQMDEVEWRIGIDTGPILLARIGVNKGTADHDRSFLTAVGSTANIASKIQHIADTDQIWIGDLTREEVPEEYQKYTRDRTPTDWTWIFLKSGDRYRVFEFWASWTDPRAEKS